MNTNDYSPLKESLSSSKSYGSIYHIGQPFDPRKSAVDISLFSNIAQNLRFRRGLFEYRRFTAKFSLLIGLFGFSLAILDNQLSVSFHQPSTSKKNYLVSFVIKLCISITTLILMILIIIYHYLDLRIEMQRYNVNDWKLALGYRRVLKFLTEMLICFIQPLPVAYPTANVSTYSDVLTTYDGIMTILMCLRFYLLARVLILRSSLHQDIIAQSFGAINHTSVNTKFIFKSWMTLYSIYILIGLIIFIFIWGSWATTVCETAFTFSDSMWLTAVTFLSIGYGDIIPISSCGRAVAVLTGALGAGCTALIVAIVSSKLELSQSEKYLHNFVQDLQLNQKLRHLSANIIKYSWKLFTSKTQKKIGHKARNVSYYRRQLLYNIRAVRAIRSERRQLSDSGISIYEVSRSQIETRHLLKSLNDDIDSIESQLELIANKLNYK